MKSEIEPSAETTALEDEKEAIRKGMEVLKGIYIESGWETADNMLGEICNITGSNDFLFRDYASACNCFHGGMYEIMCDDFSGTWDFYEYCKHSSRPCWSNPSEWFESMKGDADYIVAFIKLVQEINMKYEFTEEVKAVEAIAETM